jgi:uncharacterized protein YecA (UPF0149 family)
MKKVTEEELSKLQELVSAINEGQATIGGLEMQKASVMGAVAATREELNKMQAELKETYGDVNINLSSGEITDADNPQD